MSTYEFELFRDPIHGFIQVSPLELRIIDSKPFQRLRGIKQLALTNLVYHGAEHTRFGHSLGVMHLVTRAFRIAAGKSGNLFTDVQLKWYEQILRLMALVHDLGHAPFSYGSEAVFPEGLEHEDFTDKIVLETKIAEYISDIGEEFRKRYGSEFDINPGLICAVYRGKNVDNPDFIFLRKFMDSELDCDKMDYLLRDSFYCGVSYGKYDLERLLNCLTVYKKGNNIFLAVEKGGLYAFEEFVLARYFMFLQVYFHKTRRFLDSMLVNYLKTILPQGRYPDKIEEYLEWDDCRVWENMADDCAANEFADRIINRRIMKNVYETSTYSADINQKKIFNLLSKELKDEFGETNFLFDSADKMIHKIPQNYEIDSEKVIPIIRSYSERPVTIAEESVIIRKMVEPINIRRIYAHEGIANEAFEFIQRKIRDMEEDV